MKKEYDYIIVGAGLTGATFAYLAKQHGKRCLVIDKRHHYGGNIYCEKNENIIVHKYGPHVFHTDNKNIWTFVNKFVPFHQYALNTIAKIDNKLYTLPFNMHTFYQTWGITNPNDAMRMIDKQKSDYRISTPQNLEEQAISLVGCKIYNTLIKGYTEKQWGKHCKDLPTNILHRIPIRYNYNNNYFDDSYQGIPDGGYNVLIAGMLNGIECRLNCNYLDGRDLFDRVAEKILYTGPIDELLNYDLGCLDYRSLKFEHERLPINNFQGNAIVNYPDANIPYTRIVEHKWFDYRNLVAVNAEHTIITREYPIAHTKETEPYYPICDPTNMKLYKEYIELASIKCKNFIFAGRLGTYKYMDMDDAIENAFKLFEKYECA